jgi:hypothetical protein
MRAKTKQKKTERQYDIENYQFWIDRAEATIAELRNDGAPEDVNLTADEMRHKYLYPAKAVLWELDNIPIAGLLRVELRAAITEFERICDIWDS